MSIDSRLENVGLIGMAVNKLCSLAPFSDVGRYQIELCVVEAVTNAIVHAYGRQPGHEVEVDLCLDDRKIELRISDNGSSMRFERPPRLEYDHQDLSSLPEGGMGLCLIDQAMSDVQYEVAGGRNTLILIKQFDEAPAGVEATDGAGS